MRADLNSGSLSPIGGVLSVLGLIFTCFLIARVASEPTLIEID